MGLPDPDIGRPSGAPLVGMRLTSFLTTFLMTFLASSGAGAGTVGSGATGWTSSSLRFGGAPLPLEEMTRLGFAGAFSATGMA